MNQRYCFDTSVFINGWRKHYVREVFPSLWDAIDSLIDDGVVFSCEEVYREIEKKDDDLFGWAKIRKNMFEKPTQKVLSELTDLMSKYPNFAAQGGRSTNAADPWVIAHAKIAGATVVTDEFPTEKTVRATVPPKIPDVCSTLEIPWMRPVDFFIAANIRV